MEGLFTKKVRAAVKAGWWTLLIAWCLLLIQWIVYLWVMSKQPAAMVCLWGGGVTWQEIRMIWLFGMAAYKICLAMMFFGVIWLTLWSKQLEKGKMDN